MDLIEKYLGEAKPTKAVLNNAVKAMQLYLGSLDKTRIMDQQKLRNRIDKIIDKIANTTGMDIGDIWDQVEAQAKRKGTIVPMPGRDI